MNRNIIYSILFSFALLFTLASCDEISEPYTKGNEVIPPIDNTQPKILIEEFTGIKCVHCPKGAAMITQLEAAYPDKIIAVGIHAGLGFANPDKNPPLNYDFRTKEGNEIYDFYDISLYGQPCALINRTTYENSLVLMNEKWNEAITQFWDLYKAAEVKIEVKAWYEQSSRRVTAEVNLNYLASQTELNKLSVWILEDSVVKAQKTESGGDASNGSIITNYVNNHALRYSFNGTWGESVNDGNIPLGFMSQRLFEYTLPADCDWNPDHLKIVAFVYTDNAGVKNAEEAEVEKTILLKTSLTKRK
ncbi:MAG: Omp28 family outer membrane lipoprotein [Ignavibacteria bacterium]|jgi:thiol-disulfide isomerase/thioredoxin|nr:Omp28 family outer membrane lipoprotein [Ignavibacteria bacterium]